MKNLSINMKLIVGFGIVLVLLVTMGLLSYINMGNISTQVELYGQYTVPNAAHIRVLQVRMQGILYELLEAIHEDDAKVAQEALDMAASYGKEIVAELDVYQNNQRSDAENADFENLRTVITEAAAARGEIAKLITDRTVDFAVVAGEVRNLAAKSAEAAKQTAELIKASVATVSKGTQITTQTAQILHEVGDKAQLANESIIRIDQASADQVAAIEQIKQGLFQVSAVVQTNAATAEENSATSEEMSAQAATLREEVGRFKLDSGYESESFASISLLDTLPKAGLPRYKAAADLGKY